MAFPLLNSTSETSVAVAEDRKPIPQNVSKEAEVVNFEIETAPSEGVTFLAFGRQHRIDEARRFHAPTATYRPTVDLAAPNFRFE